MAWRKCSDCGFVFEAPNNRTRICPECKTYRAHEICKKKREEKPKKKFPPLMQVSRIERIYNAVNGTKKHYGEIVNIIESTATDRCVCCGDVIPEGRMVCPACEQKGRACPY